MKLTVFDVEMANSLNEVLLLRVGSPRPIDIAGRHFEFVFWRENGLPVGKGRRWVRFWRENRLRSETDKDEFPVEKTDESSAEKCKTTDETDRQF
jgi:hypothetical protein